MTIPPPPYLLEYRVARALMASGNIGPAKLIDMLEAGEAFLYDGDLREYEKCPLCKDLPVSHKDCFVKASSADIATRGAIAEKLITKGKLAAHFRMMAEPTISIVAVASREGLKCVLKAQQLWDTFGVCKAASVTGIAMDDFVSAIVT